MAKRIGPQMAAVAAYVVMRPGCLAVDAARSVAPHGTGIGFGYRSVDRACDAELIKHGTCEAANCTRPNVAHRHLWST